MVPTIGLSASSVAENGGGKELLSSLLSFMERPRTVMVFVANSKAGCPTSFLMTRKEEIWKISTYAIW